MNYEGIKYVTEVTTITLQINDEKIQKLYNLFKSGDYFSFDSSYTDQNLTDLPTVMTSLKFGENYKRIKHYLGDQSAPQELSDLEIAVEEILDTENLTGFDPASHYFNYP